MKISHKGETIRCDGFDLIRKASNRLGGVSPTPFLDAEVLFFAASGLTRESLISIGSYDWEHNIIEKYDSFIERRLQGESVSYITGTKEFYGYDFKVNRSVLIPRPETELLVERALDIASKKDLEQIKILDLGTGSGCIAISIVLELKKRNQRCEIFAIDKSSSALEVARANAKLLAADVNFIESDWFSALAGQRFDLIVCNPPYIARDDSRIDPCVRRFEPEIALFAEEDGFGAYKTILSGAVEHLTGDGVILFEVGEGQSGAVRQLCEQYLRGSTEAHKDLAGIERLILGTVLFNK